MINLIRPVAGKMSKLISSWKLLATTSEEEKEKALTLCRGPIDYAQNSGAMYDAVDDETISTAEPLTLPGDRSFAIRLSSFSWLITLMKAVPLGRHSLKARDLLENASVRMDELPALKWQGNFALLPLEAVGGNSLDGDKIILPQSALEQLLSASASQAVMQNNYTTPSAQLPNPLTFRLVNPATNKAVYAGIREFSAPEGTVMLSPYLLSALGLATDSDATTKSSSSTASRTQLDIHAATLPKGTYARLRPLEAGYNPDDWRPLLERQLRRNFTSLTKNATMLVYGVRGEVFQLLVDKLSPEAEGVCVVDTDLEVDIEPLDEEQARETLRQVINTGRQANGSGGAKGGAIDIWKPVSDEIAVGSYVDYTLPSWDRSQPLQLTLSNMSDPDALELFVTPKSGYQRALPRNTEHVFSTFDSAGSSTTKTKVISPTNVEMEKAESIQISVYAYPDPTDTIPRDTIQYTLRAQICRGNDEVITVENVENTQTHGENEAQCLNCQQWVPKQSLVLHESFCRRNNIICPKCKMVFKKGSDEFNAHWHCEHDEAHGTTPYSKYKHDDIFHGSWLCPSCTFQTNSLPDLARHRSTGADIGLCSLCFGPLYVSMHDPDGKALRRRIERRYLTQLMSGCRKSQCINEWCKTGRANAGLEVKGSSVQAALPLVKPLVATCLDLDTPMYFCVDELSQTGRKLAAAIASEGIWDLECGPITESAGSLNEALEKRDLHFVGDVVSRRTLKPY
ncbi:hypothetical protein LMH87_009382 [Akanthomyces muscarius]|uniref:Ubiquitin fusion degradation protein n=1 Tax=Akanthomyces muscarius TaxID=2231603 RepID=A0A9W8UM39_AKAMU|nr:hypothetical protein LMH87_009382 [Akanthomyces muscarius]KAJ4152862.1 hypothetical protein LMH87_009382 [Akanthomyces muscarius]